MKQLTGSSTKEMLSLPAAVSTAAEVSTSATAISMVPISSIGMEAIVEQQSDRVDAAVYGMLQSIRALRPEQTTISVDEVARALDLSESTVISSMARLQDLGVKRL